MNTDKPAVAWAITGAGHFLAECIALIEGLRARADIDVYLSRAAAEVVPMYGLEARLREACRATIRETGHSFPVAGRFSVGAYGALVVAPATGNTVSKFVMGIADTLVSSLFAQAGKSRVPICVLPTDVAEEVLSPAPNGQLVRVFPRSLDLRQTEELEGMEGVALVRSPEALREWLAEFFS